MRRLPEWIEVGGRRVPILTDYRAPLVWFEAVSGAVFLREQGEERARLVVRVLCLEEPGDLDEAVRALSRFLLCGEEPGDEDGGIPVIDFCRDWQMIWAGFRARYGIDLDRERMHWWRFRALLDELDEDTTIKRVMRLRAEPPPTPGQGADAAEIARYRRLLALREQYALEWAEC